MQGLDGQPMIKKSRNRWTKDSRAKIPYRTYLDLKKRCKALGIDIDNPTDPGNEQIPVPSNVSHENQEILSENGSESSSDNGDDNQDIWDKWDNLESGSQLNEDIDYEILRTMYDEQLRAEISDDDDDDDEEDDDDYNEDDYDDITNDNFVYNGRLVSSGYLYPGCKTTVEKAVLELMNVYIKKKLTKSTLVCLLKLFQLILPDSNIMPKSLHKLFKFIKQRATTKPAVKHYYCKSCRQYKEQAMQKSTCSACKKTNDTGFFYELDISNQIEFLFEHRDLASKLQPFNEHRDPHIIADILDGSEYKRVNSRPERNVYDLTLILNTDGLSLVKSSKSNCWPLMFMIAELPPHIRENYIVVIGLWYDSDHKPLMNTFLRPFCHKLKQCYEKGIQWTNSNTKQTYVLKVVAPLFNADAPARADILNMQSFNGKFGCNICEIMTSRCQQIEKKRTIRIFAYKKKQSEIRTDAKIREQAIKADRAIQVSKNSKTIHVKGIKGTSIISILPSLSIGTCVTPEYMHSMLLGVGKQFLNLWINVKGVWNITQHREAIESFQQKIRPPTSFHRMPRSIFIFNLFKAWEILVWILYYSIPTLSDKLSDMHLQHWILFVRGLYILMQDRITQQNLREAKECLQKFVKDIKKLYNDRAYTYNVHQILHLVLCVERWGPLHLTSAFPFEDLNGFLSHCVHGSKHQGEEIIKYISIVQGTQILKSYYSENEQKIHDEKKFILIGKEKNSTSFLNPSEQTILINNHFDLNDMIIFSRSKKGALEFSSQCYKKTKTNSCFVKIKIHNKILYASIRFYFTYEEKIFIMLQHFTIEPEKMFVNKKISVLVHHILPIKMENKYSLIATDDIESIYHLIRVGDFVCEQPNSFTSIF